jgi:hypothetical protein
MCCVLSSVQTSRTSISSTRKNGVYSRSSSESKTTTISKERERIEQRLKNSVGRSDLKLAVIVALNAD